MDAVLVNLLESVARPVALAVVHSLWQGAVMAGLVAVALFLLRGRSASARYLVAGIGLVAILSAGVATGVWYARHPEGPADPKVIWHSVVRSDETEGEDPALAFAETGSAGEPGAADDEVAPSGEQLRPARSGLSLPQVDLELAGPWVFAGWAAGVLVLGALHIGGWRQAVAMSRVGTRALSPDWARRVARLCERMGLAGHVRTVVSKRVTVPTVVGWVRPVVLVPAASFTDLTAAQLELVLIHELAHVRRHDLLVNYLQAAAETLLFYHPAVWWISRRIRIEREHCCDDAVVRLSGDGAAYARALSEVESMRERVPVHAMAADGGAFKSRIRRILGVPSTDVDSRSSRAMAGVLVVALVLGLFVPSLTAAPTGSGDASAAPPASQWKDIKGEWRAEGFGGSIRLHFDLPAWGECSLTFDNDNLTETDDGLRFERDAGTFILEGGRIPRRWREAIFRPDPVYAEKIQDLGYDIEKEEHLLELAIHDVTLDFASGIAAAGYDISRGRLIEFHIHDVTPAYVRAMADAGYEELTPGRIIEFAIHDVEPEYVRRLAAIGYDDLTPGRMLEFAIHDVEAEYVERMAAIGYDDLTPSRLLEFRIHDVTPEYVERMASIGYDELTTSRILEFSIHDVEPEYVERLVASGYENLSASRILEFKIHGISPGYIEDMAALGYENLAPSRLVEFAIHDVEPSYVRGLQEVGYGDISPSRLLEFRIHDVTPAFIRRLKSLGLEDLSPGKVLEYKIRGIRLDDEGERSTSL